MKKERYIQIKEFLRELLIGTEWEGHVYTVGGCVRDELMGSEIKDIDLCVSLPDGGVRFAQWLRDNGYAMNDVTVYPNYGTAMLHLKAFPDVELEFVQTRKGKYIGHSCRNPETVFGTIEDDCMYRDLTINTLYSNISTGERIDITGKIRVRTEKKDRAHSQKHEQVGSKMVIAVLRAMNYSHDFIREVRFLVKHHEDCKECGGECEQMKPEDLRKLQYECSLAGPAQAEERFHELMLLIDADNNAHAADSSMSRQVELILQQTERMKAEGTAMFGYKRPLTGKNVMEIKDLQTDQEVMNRNAHQLTGK